MFVSHVLCYIQLSTALPVITFDCSDFMKRDLFSTILFYIEKDIYGKIIAFVPKTVLETNHVSSLHRSLM